jgi:hypothetical protein
VSPILILEATGPRAETLAMAAGENRGIAVGFDPEFESFTFDADGVSEEELQTVVFEELGSLEPEWRSHLNPVD